MTSDRQPWSRKRRWVASILLGLAALVSVGSTAAVASGSLGAAHAWLANVFHDPNGCGGG